ncbi:MAG TPA: hypothetical protein VFO63_06255, partial [Blastocatellia bacterium]|nr:hypothetical protein [Blastocatellia bacterium]
SHLLEDYHLAPEGYQTNQVDNLRLSLAIYSLYRCHLPEDYHGSSLDDLRDYLRMPPAMPIPIAGLSRPVYLL